MPGVHSIMFADETKWLTNLVTFGDRSGENATKLFFNHLDNEEAIIGDRYEIIHS